MNWNTIFLGWRVPFMYLGSIWLLPRATMHTYGGKIKGDPEEPPIDPILDIVTVPPV